jgi:hypothetical protein
MGNYVTVADVLAEGVPATTDPAKIDRRIDKWELLTEQLTGQVFRIISPGELIFDGNDTSVLHFNLPIVAVASLKINGETTALDPTFYRAHIGRGFPQDDRRNPKIVLSSDRGGTIYNTPGKRFYAGAEQRVTATWGFVETDDSTPKPIKDVIVQLVILDLDGYFVRFGSDSGSRPTTSVRRERTDGHEIEYMGTTDPRVTWMSLPQEISDVLSAYRAPIKIASAEPIYTLAGAYALYGF